MERRGSSTTCRLESSHWLRIAIDRQNLRSIVFFSDIRKALAACS